MSGEIPFSKIHSGILRCCVIWSVEGRLVSFINTLALCYLRQDIAAPARARAETCNDKWLFERVQFVIPGNATFFLLGPFILHNGEQNATKPPSNLIAIQQPLPIIGMSLATGTGSSGIIIQRLARRRIVPSVAASEAAANRLRPDQDERPQEQRDEAQGIHEIVHDAVQVLERVIMDRAHKARRHDERHHEHGRGVRGVVPFHARREEEQAREGR